MTTTLSENQARALRLIVSTHGGCRVNLHTARALESRGLVTLPLNSPNVPRATEAGVAFVNDPVAQAVTRLERKAAEENADPANWTSDPHAKFDEDGQIR